MTAPAAPLTPQQITELQVLMTQAGYSAAVSAFGNDTIRQFVATRPCLLLTAADLLDGLPVVAGETESNGGDLKRFKLDVLEFEYTVTKTTAIDYGAISKNLRARAVTECSGGGRRRRTANPAPEFQTWGLV